MGKLVDLSGQTFGRLFVLERGENYVSPKGQQQTRWVCLCECGTEAVVVGTRIKRGITSSCGCLNRELLSERATSNKYSVTHGHFLKGGVSPTIQSYNNMLQRCLNPLATGYFDYGGRGITVHPSWRESFENFLCDMGERPANTSLDRIDTDGNYELGNCQWADNTTQSYNQRKRKDNISGRTGVCYNRNIDKWVARISINKKTINLGNFLTFEEAVKVREAAEVGYFGQIKE